jgi:DNA repair protein RadC
VEKQDNTASDRLSIREWAKDDRPREKLMELGASVLSDAELLAILVRSGSRSESAVDLCKRILGEAQNDLSSLSRMSLKELMKFRGMGEAKALSIIAALEIGRRRKEREPLSKVRITSSAAAYVEILPKIGDLQHEEFWVLLLSRSNDLVKMKKVGQGGIHGTVADPKVIFKEALENSCPGMIVCHNHPSGQLRPSEADIRLTEKLVKGGKLLDIAVLDHLIVTADGYYSFADEGRIQ